MHVNYYTIRVYLGIYCFLCINKCIIIYNLFYTYMYTYIVVYNLYYICINVLLYTIRITYSTLWASKTDIENFEVSQNL